MKKINGGYLSLFEYLVRINFPFAAAIDKKLYPVEHATLEDSGDLIPYDRRYNENPRRDDADQIIGALQPLASMAHDFQYTFKPYKSRWDFLRDLAQPIRGFGHILRGLANLGGSILFFLVKTAIDVLTTGSLNTFVENIVMATSWFIDGLSSSIRGLTQVLATPLTWALKIPLRGIITGIKGTPDLRENEEIQRLVILGEKAIKHRDRSAMKSIKYRLDEEYKKALAAGQRCEIPLDKEVKAFKSLGLKYSGNLKKEDKENAQAFLGLFRKPKEISPLELLSSKNDLTDPSNDFSQELIFH